MGVQIVYTSRTGNTEKLAEAVFAAVPVKEKNVKRIEERTERDDGEMYLVGFWTDRGTASSEILDLLGNLHGKKVALFGTCGMGCMLLFNALGLGLSVLMLTAWSGYFTTVTGGTTLPTLTVLMSLDMNWLVVLYCLVLFLCMISSGVVVVFGFINRFENAKYLSFMKNTQLRRGAIATAIMAVSMFISFAGLTNIVKYGYGYCGYWAIVFVIVPLLTVGYKKNRDYLKGRREADEEQVSTPKVTA